MGLVSTSRASDSHGSYAAWAWCVRVEPAIAMVSTSYIRLLSQFVNRTPRCGLCPSGLRTGERGRGFSCFRRRRPALPVAAVGLAGAGAEDEREGEAVVALGADRLDRRGAHALADLRAVAGEHLVQAPRAEHG